MRLKILIILLSNYRQKADISKLDHFGGADKMVLKRCVCVFCFTDIDKLIIFKIETKKEWRLYKML